ncbi:hypothetical protein ACFVYJ_02915 [Pontibacter sp. JAM-7]|uniref:hypothetical protein n=1 Tax=Pontibacter sp. JAM-7 TaxID=3366581 RepID=UPI003AF7FC84
MLTMRKLINPTLEQLTASPEQFLRQMAGPVMVFVEGQQTDRCRGLVTLLHGNEPSGLRALHHWLLQQHTPICNLVCFIPSVAAALTEPLFTHRTSVGQRDMNRCFLPPYNDAPGLLAEEILALFSEFSPECVIDMHNTSGHSPDFGVVTLQDMAHEALVSLFSQRLIVTDLRLGALMETSTQHCPVVTVECGGAGDAAADQIARMGVHRYLTQDNVLQLAAGRQMDLYHHPVRLELNGDAAIAYADRYVLGTDLTIPPDLDRYNFETVDAGTLIGWLGQERRKAMRVCNAIGEDVFDQFFCITGNQLLTRRAIKLFMITTRPEIAISDCLLYAAMESEHEMLYT